MKILAVDDNPMARNVMRAFLEKSGYMPVIADDGTAALKVMQEPDAPQIVVLDWMMPGLNGLALCTKLRSLNLSHRPYIILLTAKHDKADIAAGLDAGADEFVTKPFSQVEMLARLRAARRAVAYENELQQRIDELAALVERHEMLEDLIAKNTATAQAAPAAPIEPGFDLVPAEIEHSVRQACASLGWTDVSIELRTVSGAYQRPSLLAWAGCFVDPAQAWLDFMLEAEFDSGATLFERSMRMRPTSDRALLDYLAEILNFITLGARNALQARDNTVIAPYLSRGLRSSHLSEPLPVPQGEREVYTITIEGVSLGLSVLKQGCPVREKTAGQLNRSDILAAPFQPSEAYQIPLLNRGTLLTDRFIERLVAFARSEGVILKIPVFEPSPVAMALNPQRTERRTLAPTDF